jgi:hypothetical protein
MKYVRSRAVAAVVKKEKKSITDAAPIAIRMALFSWPRHYTALALETKQPSVSA